MVGLGAVGEGEEEGEARVEECGTEDVDEEVDCGGLATV